MKLFNIIKIILGIAIMLLLLYKVGVKEVAATITEMNILLLPAIIILFIAGLYIGAYNIKLLTDAIKAGITMGEMWVYYLKSWAIGMMVPGKIGEFSFVYLARKQLSTGQATAIAVLDKLITAGTLCALAGFGLFVYFPFQTALNITLMAAAAGLVGLIFIFTKPGRAIIRKIIGKYRKKFEGFSKTIDYLVLEQKTAATLNVIITFLKWGLTAIVTYLAFLAFGQSVSPLVILTVSATTMLISLVPITMSGLGIKEGAAVYLYGIAAGVPAATTISAHIVLLLLNYLGAAAVFFFVKK